MPNLTLNEAGRKKSRLWDKKPWLRDKKLWPWDKKLWLRVLIAGLAATLLTGCFDKTDTTKEPVKKNPLAAEPLEAGPKPQPLKDPATDPLTGLQVEKANLARKPLAIMVENSPQARPQSGLDKADLIYEALAEGGITRFMAIFAGGDTGEIGPVRSARPYFIDRSEEYDAVYVHAGGSPEALAQIKTQHIADLNQFGNNFPFWRSKNRKAPHNLYGSTLKIRQVAAKKWPDYSKELPGFSFLEPGSRNPEGVPANSLTIHFGPSASKVKWTYNGTDHKYYRFNGGSAHKDAVTGQQLAAANIIVQYTSSKVIDGEGRRRVDMVGRGSGALFTGGQRYEIKWIKDGRHDFTRFSLAGGGEIRLTPGQTWVEVVPKGTSVQAE